MLPKGAAHEATLLTSSQIEATFIEGVKKKELTVEDEDVEADAATMKAASEIPTIVAAGEEGIGDDRRRTRPTRPT